MRVFISNPVQPSAASKYAAYEAIQHEVIKFSDNAYRVNTIADKGNTIDRFPHTNSFENFDAAIDFIDYAKGIELN